MNPTLSSLKGGCSHLIHIKPRKRGFDGGNFSHGLGVHRTWARAGPEPKGTWTSTARVWVYKDWIPRLGGGLMNQQYSEHKLFLGPRTCRQRDQRGCGWWTHKSAHETKKQLSTSARSPMQVAILWQCQFKNKIFSFLSSPLSMLSDPRVVCTNSCEVRLARRGEINLTAASPTYPVASS